MRAAKSSRPSKAATSGERIAAPPPCCSACRSGSSFFAAWPALGESWEISLDPDAAPSSMAWCTTTACARASRRRATSAHGARRSGGRCPPSPLPIDRVPWLAGTLGDDTMVVHLDVRRRIAALRVPGADPPAPRCGRPRGAAARTSGGCRPATGSTSSIPPAGCAWPGTRCRDRCATCRPPTKRCGPWSASATPQASSCLATAWRCLATRARRGGGRCRRCARDGGAGAAGVARQPRRRCCARRRRRGLRRGRAARCAIDGVAWRPAG